MDVDNLQSATALARKLLGAVGLFKVGSQLFTAEGPRAVEKLADAGAQIFLDLKFHDIPNTVAKAVSGALKLPHVRLLTLHASGGTAVMQAAREAAGERKDRPKLLAVTVLTSFNEATLREIGMSGPIENRAVALARLAKKAGMDGAVCSAHEARAVRRACGPKFIILIPGVRPSRGAANDQSRIATPAEAVRAGADYLVVGRPITAAPHPKSAVLDIVAEMKSAL
ncbi:MAG TPA: orotidine-5'-phosphate decarboxylase [Candidatus Binatus sp.]|nr:orotidine-5'-phosphate decarboxylase [Candidatus Binatus sp.]